MDEQQQDTTVNKVNGSVCAACDKPSVRICTHCGQEFCADHFCPMHETTTASEPLVDDEGVRHNGRRLRLIGEGWPNALQSLDNMSDDQLREYITGMQKLLEQAIQTGNYASISIAAAEYKLAYKEHSRYVAAMKRREKIQKQGAIRLNAKQTKIGDKKIPADIAALMVLGNISYEQAVAAKAMLGKAKS